MNISSLNFHDRFLYSFYTESISEYNLFKRRMLDGELEKLSPEECKNVLDFFSKIEVIHTAFEKKDFELIKMLIKNGLELENDNYLDYGNLNIEFINWLLENEVKISVEDEKTILKKCFRYFNDETWHKILIKLLKNSMCNPFILYPSESNTFIQIAKSNEDLEKKILDFFIECLNYNSEKKEYIVLNNLLYFLEKGIKKIDIEELTNSYALFNSLLQMNEDDLIKIKQHLPASKLGELEKTTGNLKSSLICFKLLNTKKIDEINDVFQAIPFGMHNFLRDFNFIIDNDLKLICKNHIQSMQDENVIWKIISYDSKILNILKKMDCDPNWTNKNNENILFTSLIGNLSDNYFDVQYNYSQINNEGLNALEYHCSKEFIDLKSINILMIAGLKLSDHFSHYALAKEICPSNSYYQVLITIYFNLADENKKKIFLYKLDNQLRNELVKMLDKYILKEDEVDYQFYIKKNKSLVIKDQTDYIPESALASRIIQILLSQHQNESKNSKIVSVENLFSRFTNHDDLIHTIQYLFENPTVMNIFFQTYMKVNEVNIKPMGSTKSTFAQVVHTLLERMKDFGHFPKAYSQLNSSAKKLIKAFKKEIPPFPIKTFEISQNSSLKLLNRTIVVYGENKQCDAFKFLKPKEDYFHFSQEYSVTKALRETSYNFESQFHEPVGIFALKEFPEAFKEYEENFFKGPYYVYHYKASPKVFKYPQDISQRKYDLSREKSLKDATKMNKLGIAPDLASLFHNEEQKRAYLLLIDLVISMGAFKAAGGAGRLDQAFSKVQYPNMRTSGLTDMRDARVYYLDDWEKVTKETAKLTKEKKTQYAFPLFGLSNILLVDMLIQVERYKKLNKLDWRDEKFLGEFAEELKKGFVLVASTYSGKSIEQWGSFAEFCGIDWILMARQISFWTDSSETGYPSYVANKKLPENLYQEGVKIKVDCDNAENFDSIKGFESFGKQDIGAYNGPLALTEFEKQVYSLIFAIILAEPLTS